MSCGKLRSYWRGISGCHDFWAPQILHSRNRWCIYQSESLFNVHLPLRSLFLISKPSEHSKCYMYSFTLLILSKCLFSDCQHTNITITSSKLQKFRATSFKCPEGDLFSNEIFPTHLWMSKQKLLFLNLFVGILEYNLPMLFYSAGKSPFSNMIDQCSQPYWVLNFNEHYMHKMNNVIFD